MIEFVVKTLTLTRFNLKVIKSCSHDHHVIDFQMNRSDMRNLRDQINEALAEK